MARFLIQSGITWEFLHVDPRTGDLCWTPSLATAIRFGVADDLDQVAQLQEDHCDRGQTLVIDLDLES